MGDATMRFFDAMAASYDELEPWYEHLYAELHRILRSALSPAAPGARLLLEYERRWCLDLAWTLVSSVMADAFGYGLRPAEARALVASPWRTGVWVDYPGYPRLRLFTDRELGAMFESSGLRVEQSW